MSSVRIIGGTGRLTDEVNAFAESIDPALARWRYAAKAGGYRFFSKHSDEWVEGLNLKAVPSLAQLLGISPSRAKLRLSQIIRCGLEDTITVASKYDALRVGTILPPYLHVGPLPQWCCGHVYFARVSTHPHVLKIGFSRRVHERLEDISAKNKIGLVVPEGHLKVGTQADEHWWHSDWSRYRIDGEWFFDPKSSERSLPDFLTKSQVAA